MSDNGTTNIVTTLLDDWHAPSHVEPIQDYGKARMIDDGYTVFGFRCTHCQAGWRRDFCNSDEFNTSVGLMRVWLEKHRHAPINQAGECQADRRDWVSPCPRCKRSIGEGCPQQEAEVAP
jgi:hypothetical protein